jgi:hypothetical protein
MKASGIEPPTFRLEAHASINPKIFGIQAPKMFQIAITPMRHVKPNCEDQIWEGGRSMKSN